MSYNRRDKEPTTREPEVTSCTACPFWNWKSELNLCVFLKALSWIYRMINWLILKTVLFRSFLLIHWPSKYAKLPLPSIAMLSGNDGSCYLIVNQTPGLLEQQIQMLCSIAGNQCYVAQWDGDGPVCVQVLLRSTPSATSTMPELIFPCNIF